MVFKKNNYDDSKVREFGIKFTKDVFNLIFESHPNCKAIDLINPDDYSHGVELERGGWTGNFWDSDYSLISGLESRTINIPIRKLKYWYSNVNDERIPNEYEHLFIRTNKDFTQVILIRPITIKDETKILFTEVPDVIGTATVPDVTLSALKLAVTTWSTKLVGSTFVPVQ